jgi:hypothetical protein
MAKVEHPLAQSFTLALSLSLVHLSLYTLSHSSKKRRRKGEGIEARMQQEMAMETT